MTLIQALGPNAAEVILILGVLVFSLGTAIVAVLSDY